MRTLRPCANHPSISWCWVQVQFVAGMVHAAQSLLVSCKYPIWMQWALIVYGMSILGLFLNFYFHAYIKPKVGAWRLRLYFFTGCRSCLRFLTNAIQMGQETKAVVLYYCPDCPSSPANAIQLGQATWAIWTAVKKYSLR